jgi:hypothetical protein
MRVHIKKFVMVKDTITPGQVNATHRRFWDYIKGKPLRVLVEDKTEVIVRAEDGEQYNLKKEFVEVVDPREAIVG